MLNRKFFDEGFNVAIKVETRSASAAIHSVSEKLKAANQSEPNLSREILTLDNAALLLGQPPGDGGHGQERAIVCPEHYIDTYNYDWPYNLRNWVLEDCGYGRKVGELVTLVFSVDKEEQVYNNFYHLEFCRECYFWIIDSMQQKDEINENNKKY